MGRFPAYFPARHQELYCGPIWAWAVRVHLTVLIVLLSFLNFSAVFAQSKQTGDNSFPLYWVRIAEPKIMVVSDRVSADFLASARNVQRDELHEALEDLKAAGFIGAISYDTAEYAFVADLSEIARGELSGNPLVSSIELMQDKGALWAPPIADGTTGVSSVVFIQVYSPFMWGRTNIGGLNVQLTLEDGLGGVKGVPTQGTAVDSIKIDRTQLYFETVFVDPSTRKPVMILPGDKVHITTTGDNPATPDPDPPEDKRITIEDLQACTSFEEDYVSGIAPANSSIVVTALAPFPSLSSYLTPGSSMTYAETTSGPDGKFYVDTFRTSTDPTYKKINIQRGQAGFVRFRRADGNEIYTVHGQNVFVLLNSRTIHGYAFALPYAPNNPILDPGVQVSRPATTFDAVLKNLSGIIKDGEPVISSCSGTGCYKATFSNMVLGGDIVEVAINQNLIKPVVTLPVVFGDVLELVELLRHNWR